MKYKVLFTILVSIVAGCATSIETSRFTMPLDERGWRVANAQDYGSGKGAILEVIRKDESLVNWTEMVTIQFIEGREYKFMEVMEKLKEKMANRCSNVKWEVSEKDDTSVVYEWSISSCGEITNQHEIARLMQGNEGVHRVAFVKKGVEIDSSTFGKIKERLLEAYVVKDGEKVVLQSKL